MIDLIITGHGNFASGLVSASNLIIGQDYKLNFVEFTDDCSPEELKKTLLSKVNSLPASTLIIFTDLVGGTPYKVAIDIAIMSSKKIHVLGGVNLPMVIEASLSINVIDNDVNFISSIKDQGKLSIDDFKLTSVTVSDNDLL